MTRQITSHKLNDCNNGLDIFATDEPGSGGANHRYEISGFDTATNPSRFDRVGYESRFPRLAILFQNGPIPENGINGITQEALLAVVLDRLESFQNGPFPTEENAQAIYHTREALNFLHKRTTDRLDRGVEGRNEK